MRSRSRSAKWVDISPRARSSTLRNRRGSSSSSVRASARAWKRPPRRILRARIRTFTRLLKWSARRSSRAISSRLRSTCRTAISSCPRDQGWGSSCRMRRWRSIRSTRRPWSSALPPEADVRITRITCAAAGRAAPEWRRTMLKIRVRSAALLCAVAAMSTAAAWAEYPERPIRVIALNPPGGVSDTVARAVGERLAERVGQPVIVDNRVAANGIVGSEIVAKAPPDGHTLLLGFVGNLSINPGLFKKLPYDSEKDFAPISLAARSPIVVVAHLALPVTSIGELVSLVKGQPSKYAYASSGNGNGNHLATELLATMTGMQLVHVPYKGGPPAPADPAGCADRSRVRRSGFRGDDLVRLSGSRGNAQGRRAPPQR